MNVMHLRREYATGQLLESMVETDPYKQFCKWLHEALLAEIIEPYAMTLATATLQGRPSSRIVLLRGIDPSGFSFFTNYFSRKGQELTANPQAAISFYWPEIERQIHIEGAVHPTIDAESDEYFKSRPRGSQIAAWASEQSEELPSREVLDQRVAELEKQFEGQEVPRPEHWGGFKLIPKRYEFWQGRPSRLHDRLLFTWEADRWRLSRLSP